MKSERKEAIDNYIQDWFWGDKSYKFAFDLGEYILKFMDDIEESDLSANTIKKHRRNCWCIGLLICKYGYHKKFNPKILKYPPYEEIEFRRKITDSTYQVQSYTHRT